MLPRMFGDSFADFRDCFTGNELRTRSPATVGMLVDVAVIARQVAPAVDLQHKLPEGQDVPGARQLGLRSMN